MREGGSKLFAVITGEIMVFVTLKINGDLSGFAWLSLKTFLLGAIGGLGGLFGRWFVMSVRNSPLFIKLREKWKFLK